MPAATETRLRLDDPATDVVIRRSPRARRLTLTVPQTGAPPRLTAPHGASEAELRMFLLRQSDWLRAALDRAPAIVAVEAGALVPVAGRLLRVETPTGPRRPPRIDGDLLIVEGAGAPGPRIAAWLKERARAAILPVATDCAKEIGAKMGRLTMRDQTGRWGSCTSRGDVSFSWRLAMAPPAALDYVAAHEAAHLIEMNHGPRFWALVTQLRPEWRRQREWLRREGPALHRFRFAARFGAGFGAEGDEK
ncbi:MAG: SprT family zinc-dependent metalloprotease [Paracoccaceae bacterium]